MGVLDFVSPCRQVSNGKKGCQSLDVGETNVGMEIVLEDLAVETARREIAEAEVDYLRTRLEDTVTELESCKQKYDELKTQLVVPSVVPC